MSEHTVCKRCVMDSTDPGIIFNQRGICNHCQHAEEVMSSEPLCLPPSEKEERLNRLVARIKAQGKRRRYDCLIGLSGGVDSTYTAYRVKELGLRPLAVHLDNGWDSELAVRNIENACRRLNIDLYTWVLDWEEFRDLQLAFLKASTPDSEIPTDNAIFGALWRLAARHRVHYILTGYNLASESILPTSWSQGYFDAKYIKSIQRLYGTRKLKTFPLLSEFGIVFFRYLYGIQLLNFLDYIDYDKQHAKSVIVDKVGWHDYGRKHCESNYTRIFQEYVLPVKFGYDKRKAHYSSLIMAGQMNRDQALSLLAEPLYKTRRAIEEDLDYFVNKLRITRIELDEIMSRPCKTYFDYPNYKTLKRYQILKKVKRFFEAK